jgi:GPH family glycoside/pentoside/hexuronide:cation symporter
MGVFGFFAFQFMIRNTVIRVEENVSVSEEPQKFNVIKAMGNFIKNRPAVGATVAAMGMFIGMQAATTAVTVMFQSYFKNVGVSGIVTMFSLIPIVAFTPLARKLVVKYGKKELSVLGSVCSVAACTVMLLAPITPDGKGLVIYILCQLLNSLGMGIYSTVSWSMMGDAIDYNEWKFGAREEGTVYSLHSFFRKLAQGIGPSMALVIMVALGYSEINAGNQLFSVALNMRYLVAALYLFAAVMQFVGLALVYNLDKKTLEQMTTELDARHNSENTQAVASDSEATV